MKVAEAIQSETLKKCVEIAREQQIAMANEITDGYNEACRDIADALLSHFQVEAPKDQTKV